jgi:hypothetical protein
MFDVFYCGPKPGLFAFEQPAASLEEAADKSRTSHYWYIYGDNDYSNFDFEYVPVPWENSHLHVWPTQWHEYGGAYLANRNTVRNREYHFHKQVIPAQATMANWQTPHPVESFDYSWRPHPMDPPYIYVFGNQWYGPEQMPTVEYHTVGATERKYLYEPMALLPPTTEHWYTNSDVPLEFDYSWCPDPHDPPFIYVFGNQHWSGERSATVEYRVPGATEKKFVDTVRAELGVLDIFFVDCGNDTAQTRYELLADTYPNVTKVRYANSMFDTAIRCARKATTARFWIVSSEYDYTEFAFDWQPEPWQHSMTHVFPSQHQKWSDTFLISKWEFERHSSWAKSLEEFPNLNFVTDQTVTRTENLFNIYYVDHGNPESLTQYTELRDKVNADVVKTRFVDNYLDTFRRIMATATTEYVWIVNSICDYSQFDFTWEPEPWQREMIHCFPSGTQSRGDTFYIHVESFKQQMIELELLDWFNVINYCEEQTVDRFTIPAHYYKSDNLIEEIKNYNFTTPYAMFTRVTDLLYVSSHCLWSPKDRVLSRANRSGDTALVPRDIKQYLKLQLYDYPYIEKRIDTYVLQDERPDVVFISNGEPMAEDNWQALARICPWAKRSDGVTGREAAYKAAASLSDTPWFYAVFAKTEVLPTFEFDFVPDYFQEPKHYIFHSRNPLNGLEYGAMNINLYNRQLVLETEPGLDFTLSKAHEVVPVCASISRFNTDPWITWRSAFRETMKLQREVVLGAGVEIQHRLKTWCTVAEGENAEWCIRGALDGVEYHNAVGGDYEALKLSFDWVWCQEYYYNKYGRRIWLETV